MDIGGEIGTQIGLGLKSGGPHGRLALRFRAGSLGWPELDVLSFRATERISTCYSFVVRAAMASSVEPSTLEQSLIGHRAALTVQHGWQARGFHGIVESAQIESTRLQQNRWVLRMRVVPQIWLLKRRINSRVFQNQTGPDVVESLLKAAGVERQWSLQKSYPTRAYCVQYEESDYHFIKRILTECGISFYFEQPPVLFDEALDEAEAGGAMAATAIGGAIGGTLGGLATEGLELGFGTLGGLAEDAMPKETVVFCDMPSGFLAIEDTLGGEHDVALSAALSTASAAAMENESSSVGFTAFTNPLVTNSPKLYYVDTSTGTLSADCVTEFDLTRAIRSKSTVYRVSDPLSPTVPFTSKASVETPHPGVSVAGAVSMGFALDGPHPGINLRAGGDVSIIPPGASKLPPADSEVFEHHHNYLEVQWQAERNEAKLMLHQLRRHAWTATGTSLSSRLTAGHRFTLDDHPIFLVNQEYLVTRIEHEGTTAHASATLAGQAHSATSYHNRFEVVPARVNYTPKRPRRTVVQTCETATVVGPPGEDIYVDAYGRIRVQFHWDRYGTNDDRSSCWVRVVQAWAGQQWGVQFIPRVGMEVLVSFEGGDVDRPIVTGCVYHQTSPTPFELPSDKTRSGIRTRSSPGGDGFNEISFEDSHGSEQVYLRAQRNLDEMVQVDRTLRVGRNEERTIVNDQTESVGGNRMHAVRGNRVDQVTGNHESTVQQDRTDTIRANRVLSVHGDDTVAISGDHSMTIAGTERRTVTSAVEHAILDDHALRVQGTQTTLVGRSDAKRSYGLHVQGDTQFVGTDIMELSADKGIVLRCGKSSIQIGPDHVQIVSPSVGVSASGSGADFAKNKVTLRADDRASVFADDVFIKASGSTIGMGSQVDIDGAKIALKSPSSGSDRVINVSPPPTRISLTDSQGNPLPYRRYVIQMGDGSERAGMTDKDGKAVIVLEGKRRKISFPDVSNVAVRID